MSGLYNRPRALVDTDGRAIPSSYDDEEFRGDYMGGTNLIYKGFARPGSSTAEAVWQIAKLTYDGNNNITSIQWPRNTAGAVTNDYEFVWDNRATYTYV